MSEAERKAAMALAEAQRLLAASNTEPRRALVEVCRDALIRASFDAMKQGAA